MNGDPSRLKILAHQVRENPDDSFAKFALALECRKNNRLEKARVLFEDIRNRDPDYVGVYYHLGAVYELLGRPAKARGCYQNGIGVAREQNRSRTVSELEEALQELNIDQDQGEVP